MRPLPLLAFALTFAIAAGDASAASDTVLCRKVKLPRAATAGFTTIQGLTVGDRFTVAAGEGPRLVEVRKPTALCFPVGVGGGSPAPDAPLLASYETRPTRTKPAQRRFVSRDLDVTTAAGTEILRVLAPDDLAVPALLAPGPGDPGPAASLDAFACYAVRVRRRAATGVVQLSGSDVPPAVEVTQATRLCLPADLGATASAAPSHAGAWLCSAARLSRKPGRRAVGDEGEPRTVRDRFGRTTTTLGAPSELCVAVTLDAVSATPIPTPTPAASPSPTPTAAAPALVALRIAPEHVALKPGQDYRFVAIGTLSDGSERDVTEEVEWGAGYPLTAPNTPGDRSRVVVDPLFQSDFSTTISASNASATIVAFAIFDIAPNPIPLIIYPGGTAIREHTFDYLTALRLDAGGAYRNATQDVVWSSSDPSIAAVENRADIRSRVDGVSPGQAQIYATDPTTGAVAGPVLFVITGPLTGLHVRTRGHSDGQTTETMEVGSEFSIAAEPIFGLVSYEWDWLEPVTFTSSNPAVAVIELVPDQPPPLGPNGLRARVLRALTPGRARISARDEVTGISTRDRGCELTLTVRAPLVALRLQPAKRTAGLDEIVQLTALGVDADGKTRNFTQRSHYVSSDPTVVVATNEPGQRSKLVTVGPGSAVITAVDDVTGLASDTSGQNATITVRNEHVASITVTPADVHAMIETAPRFDAIGHYPSGATGTINESVVWSSSDPTVADRAEIPPRNRIGTFTAGTTVVSAAIPSLGVDSTVGGTSATLTVEPAVTLTVVPSAATLPTGGEQTFTVKAKLASGLEVTLGADRNLGSGGVVLFTSDPAVARETTACGAYDSITVYSPVLAFGPGTATIAARLPGYAPTLTSTESGGDATLTVTAP